MRLLTVLPPDAADDNARAVHTVWTEAGDEASCHRLLGSVEYRDLLDEVLQAQPDVVLISGAGGDDSVIGPIADVVWKFDSDCRVVLDGPSATPGVIVAGGAGRDQVLAALRGHRHAG